MTTRLLLFGSPTIDFRGTSFALPCERRSQLLALLALRRTWVARAELAALFWPEQSAKLAYANLRKTLFRLQSQPWAPAIESQGNVLRCAADTDVSAFESALGDGRLQDALALRRGDLLAGFDDDASEAWSSWLAFERDRLRAAWRGAALRCLDQDMAPDDGVALSSRLLEADPLDEAALRAHMTWLARSGQSAQSRRVFREYSQRLAHDLGLAPSAALQSLHDALGTAARPPAAAVAMAVAPNDGFVGRTSELRRLTSLLARDDCRLVSITGPGGVGKTRLARRALETLATTWRDGTAFVALEDVTTASALAAQLAHTLEIPAGRGDPWRQVRDHLEAREMLLALDNCEQLVAEASAIARLLADCPGVRIVATSRVRLSIAGEWLVPLSGLPYPEPEDADRVEAFDAVRLFVQAAHRVEPGLVPGSEAAAIVEICRQVEGLPLALELAAAWTRVLSCTAIAEELRHGTEILRAVDATQPARHASIEVVFDQSWRMLTPRERDALARLSIFRGGFSAEAARTIGGASLPVLGALADKSLLHKEDDRLRMHPLVQQLSAQHLPDAARAQVEREHAGYFHRLLARLQPAVSAGERDALQAVDEEFENARLAWAWSVAHGGAPMVRALASVLLHHCQHRGRLDVGLLLLRQGSDAQAARDDERLAAFLLAATAQLEYRLDRYAEAEAFAARALAMARRLRDVDAKLQAMHVLGACCLRVGRHDDARRLFTEALELAPEDVAPRNAAAMLDHLALIEKSARRFPEAVVLALRSLALHRRTGNVGGEALCLNNLGSLYGDRADHATAREYLREGLAVCERHGLVATRGHILANLAGLAAKAGDIAGAARFTAAAWEIAQSAGNRLLAGWLTFQRSQLAVKQGDLAEARAQLSAGMALAIEVGAPSLHMNGLDAFIDVLVAAGETASARRVAAFAMEHPDARALEREHFGARLAALPGGPHVAWPGLTLGELAHRLVIERDVAHAPLLAALRSS